jgi:cytochrome c-type biogenesis protein
MEQAAQISLIVAFSAGLLSFFSPCVLPLVPAYIANLAGSTAIDTNARKSYIPTLFHSLSFVLGFATVFVLLGASAGLIGNVINAYTHLLKQIAGTLIILFGIFLIASYKIPWLNYEKRLRVNTSRNPGYVRSLVIGALFSVGWTPCVGPILGAILMYAGVSQKVGSAAVMLLVYSLGMGIPFIIIGLAWGFIAPLWKGLNKHLGLISIISGGLLIIIGILMLTGQLSILGQFAS